MKNKNFEISCSINGTSGRMELEECYMHTLISDISDILELGGIITLIQPVVETVKEGSRRELDFMPYDRDGVHATGYEVFSLDRWWYEYEDGSLKG